MATKTFEELKQLAIQIRDEKINKANTATRIGTQMIEHLNKLEQEYYNIQTVDGLVSEYNVSVNHPTSGIDGSNKYTLSSAIALVPEQYRSIGIKCSFVGEIGSGECWEWQGKEWNINNFVAVGSSLSGLTKSQNNTISKARRCKNIGTLFLNNNDFYISNYGINSRNGNLEAYEGWYSTGFIPIKLGGKVKVKGGAGTNFGFAFYDRNQNYISGHNDYNTSKYTEYTGPENALFVRLSSSSSVGFVSAIVETNIINDYSLPQYNDVCATLINIDKGIYYNKDGNNFVPAEGWGSITIPCVPGQVFKIKTLGGANARAINFKDALDNVIYYSDENADYTQGITIIAPTRAETLIVNNNLTNKNFEIISDGTEQFIQKDIEISTLKKLKYSDLEDGKGINASTGEFTEFENWLYCKPIAITQGSRIKINATPGSGTFGIAFYDRVFSDIENASKYFVYGTKNYSLEGVEFDVPHGARSFAISINKLLDIYQFSVEYYNLAKHSNTEELYIKNIALCGASFAFPANGWFEKSANDLGFTPFNIAESGTIIKDFAKNYSKYLPGDMVSKIDLLVIMYTHNYDVYDGSDLKDNYTEYTDFDSLSYAACYDYVIKRFLAERASYHKLTSNVLLCTHWHNARTTYNDSIRKLSSKWGFPLVEFDKNIGVTATVNHPTLTSVDGKKLSPSVVLSLTESQIADIGDDKLQGSIQVTSITGELHSYDVERINGIICAFHPQRRYDVYFGNDAPADKDRGYYPEVQVRISNIFTDHLLKLFHK